MTVELKVLCRHASNGSSPRNEARELQANVAGPCAIAILWQLATLILANAQATNSIVVFHPFFKDGFHLCLHFSPRTARVEAFATRFRRKLLWGRRHEEALSQLPHQTNTNGRRLVSKTRGLTVVTVQFHFNV